MTLTLRGKRLVVMCKDGITPCHPYGYEFYNSGVRYTVGDDGTLEVTKGAKTLVKEQGDWLGR